VRKCFLFAVLVIAAVSTLVSAEEIQPISRSKLEQMGLRDLKVISDQEGMKVRGSAKARRFRIIIRRGGDVSVVPRW
jgi:hypothetical protein